MKAGCPIIVIGRSFGAGGRIIGRELSNLLNIPLYDNELLKATAEEFGFTREVFLRADERPPSILRRLVTQTYGVQESFIFDALSSENLYQAQSLVIRAIAKRGPCIFIGRTADYILRDFKNLVSIFIHAPIPYRAAKIMERGDAADIEEAIELARQKDKSRQEYYNYYTGRHWGDADNYDLALDSSILSPSQSAELISLFVKKISK